MMFSSSNSNGDRDRFGAHTGLISPSSFQLGSTSFPALLEEDQFFVDDFLSMSSQGQQQFLIGQGVNPDELTLIDHHSHDFVDGVMLAGSLNGTNQIPCDIVIEEEFGPGQNNQMKAKGGSSKDMTNEKDCQPLKRPAKRIRTGKKDRHSKICTAQGPRDRRMRLSLQIARKFFDLQDKLGFDKASKTIEWLFNMSSNAIREVMGNTYSMMDEPQQSYCNGTNNISSENSLKTHIASPLSANDQYVFRSSQFEHITTNQKTCHFKDLPNKLKRINKHCRSMSKSEMLKSNKKPDWPHLKKDVRDKARARARERTLEKIKLKALENPFQGSLAVATPNPSYHSCSEQIGSCGAFEHVDSSAQSQAVEELIHVGWEEIEDARLYSSYMFHATTPADQNQHFLNSGINHDEQSADKISYI